MISLYWCNGWKTKFYLASPIDIKNYILLGNDCKEVKNENKIY